MKHMDIPHGMTTPAARPSYNGHTMPILQGCKWANANRLRVLPRGEAVRVASLRTQFLMFRPQMYTVPVPA